MENNVVTMNKMLPMYSVFPTFNCTQNTGGYPRPVVLNMDKYNYKQCFKW